MKKITSVVAFLFIVQFSTAQLFVGAAYGTFNVPGALGSFRGYGPTLRIEYTGEYQERTQFFLDASVYSKDQEGLSSEIFDPEGRPMGYGTTSIAYNFKHIQLGFKKTIAGDFEESRLNFFLGAGGVLSFIHTDSKYEIVGVEMSNSKLNRTNYGFHFNAGGQLRLTPVVLELRSNFDFLLNPVTLEEIDNSSNFLTSLRFGITVPLTKWKD